MTESRKQVMKETAVMLIGQTICVGIMIAIFALLGKFCPAVLWGGIVGGLIATVYYFMMAVVATIAADRAQEQDVEGGKKLIKMSYPLRMLGLAVILIACAASGIFNVLALALPLLFIRPILTVSAFFVKKGV